jgi:hypothetical protein
VAGYSADSAVSVDSSGTSFDSSQDVAVADARPAAFKPRFYVLEPDLNQPLSEPVSPVVGTTSVDLGSRDGSVLIGETTVLGPVFTPEPLSTETFLWTEAGGSNFLGFLGDDAGPVIGDRSNAGPYWASSDGALIFGKDPRGYFQWTKAEGLVGLGVVHEGSRLDLSVFSEDGRYAAGYVTYATDSSQVTEVYRPVRWDRSGGWKVLPPLPTGYESESPWGVSSTGEVILGDCLRYNDVAGYQSMGTLPDFPHGCFAAAPRLDGKVVFGWCADEGFPRRRAVFRWTAATGMQSIGALATDPNTEFGLVSSDGSTAVGLATTYPATGYMPLHRSMFRWTITSGIVPFDSPDDYGALDKLVAISDDGHTIVGNADYPARRGIRWSEATGFVTLELAGYSSSNATGVAADGSIAFGDVSRTSATGVEEEAVLWDAAGLRDVRSELVEAGVDLKGITLATAEHVWNGATIVVQGSGTNPSGQTRAWVAVLPPR